MTVIKEYDPGSGLWNPIVSGVQGPAAATVVTSSTRPSSPYEGQIIYETDTNRLLIWDNSAWVMAVDTDQPPGLQLIKTSTVSTQSEIVVDDVFSSDFDNYRVIFTATAGSTTQVLYYQNRASGSNAATNYETAHIGYRPTNAASNVASSIVGTTFWFLTGNGSSVFGQADFDVLGPNKAAPTTMLGTAYGVDSTSNYGNSLTGRHSTATAYTGFRIYASTGTFSATCRVYGYRN